MPGLIRSLGRVLRPEVRAFLALFAVGLVLGIVWRVLVGIVVPVTDRQEQLIAVDGTLAVLLGVAGLATGVAVLLRPGDSPPRRTLVALVGSLLAAAAAWQVGQLAGTPPLRSLGVVVLWPLGCALVLFVGAATLPLGAGPTRG